MLEGKDRGKLERVFLFVASYVDRSAVREKTKPVTTLRARDN